MRVVVLVAVAVVHSKRKVGDPHIFFDPASYATATATAAALDTAPIRRRCASGPISAPAAANSLSLSPPD